MQRSIDLYRSISSRHHLAARSRVVSLISHEVISASARA
jgi:hypothetical protein